MLDINLENNYFTMIILIYDASKIISLFIKKYFEMMMVRKINSWFCTLQMN